MSDPFEAVGHGIKVASIDVEHVVVEVVDFLPKAASVLASAIKDSPELKQAVIDLITQAQSVIADAAGDVADRGINLAQDAKTLADAEGFFNYFRSEFIPLVESIYSEVQAEVQ